MAMPALCAIGEDWDSERQFGLLLAIFGDSRDSPLLKCQGPDVKQ
jgi:hypothetical protein